MKVTKPEEKMSKDDKAIEKAIFEFEKKLAKEDNDEKYYHLVIDYELNRFISDLVEQTYLDAGWSRAICKTSSENREKPGLTGLQLWR